MSVKLENIDELRRRANVSYEVAKEALESCNDDLLEALIYLEKRNKVNSEQPVEKKCSFWQGVKNLIRKGNNTKLIVSKKGNTILSLPVTAAVIITLIAPYLTVIALLIALFTAHRIRFEGKDGECKEVNSMLTKVSDTVDNAKKKMTEDCSSEPQADNQ